MNRQQIPFVFRNSVISLAISLICFVVYCFTMCRTVSFIDSGELASVAGVLGIAHPTGYPLFSIVTHCFLMLPIPTEEILRLNIFTAIVVALGVGVFYHLLIAIARYAQSVKKKGNEKGREEGYEIRIAAAVSALIFGFSTTVWSQSVAIEVYGLHIVLLLLTLVAFFDGLRLEFNDVEKIPSQTIMAVFLLGMSFANHMTTILIMPALLYLYFRSNGINRPAFVKAARIAPFFALSLSLYLYLPLRGRLQPPMDWGYPAEPERLLWHVSGKQYRSWMFSSFDSAEKQLSYFFSHFHNEFNWVVIALLLYGAWRCFRSSREVFWFLAVAFVSCLFYSVNYDIHDIDSYFLLAFIVSGIFICFGLTAIIDVVRRNYRNVGLPVISLTLLLLPASQVYLNRSEVDESDNTLVADYTKNIVSNVEPNAVIISYQWDYFVSSFQYYQLVRHEFPNVVVIDKELLRRSWYFMQLRNRYPWLFDRSRAKIDAFLSELYKFEHDLPYDPRQIEGSYVEMINDMVDRSLADRPVYVGPEIEPEFGSRYQRIPSGLLFRLAKSIDSVQFKPISVSYRPASIDTRLTRGMRGLYVKMLTSTSARFLAENHVVEADSIVNKALQIDPTFVPARSLQKDILLALKRVAQ